MTIEEIYENAKRKLDKNEITIGEFSDIVDVEVGQPTGKWIELGNEGLAFKCSLCGNKNTIESNYCPNCGARMTESEDKE